MSKKGLSDFEQRIHDYWGWSNPEIGNSWVKGRRNTSLHKKIIAEAVEIFSFEEFKSFGVNGLGKGYNASEYFKAVGNGLLEKHIDYQIKKYVELTGGKIEDLIFPNVGALIGRQDESIPEGSVIPVTAPRLAYYLDASTKFFESRHPEKTKIKTLEIGGGWGALSYLSKKNKENTEVYAIVDIPTSIAVAAYFLNEAGLSVALPNELEDLGYNHFSKVDCVFLETQQLESLPDNFFDISISTACLPELSKDLIGLYLKEMSRLSSVAYLDMTLEGRGKLARGMIMDEKKRRGWLQENQCSDVKANPTPITAYYPKWRPNCPEGEEVWEYYITFSDE